MGETIHMKDLTLLEWVLLKLVYYHITKGLPLSLLHNALGLRRYRIDCPGDRFGNCKRCLKKLHYNQQEQSYFTEEEIEKLNNILQDKLTSTVEDLLSMIDTQKCHMFHDVKVEEYMRVFDEATTTVSKIPSEEEFQDIHNYWLNMTDEKFQEEEENLLDWAAANV